MYVHNIFYIKYSLLFYFFADFFIILTFLLLLFFVILLRDYYFIILFTIIFQMGYYPLIMLRSRTVAIKGLHCQDQSFLRSLSWSEAALGMELLVTALFLEQFQHKEPQTPTTAKKT